MEPVVGWDGWGNRLVPDGKIIREPFPVLLP